MYQLRTVEHEPMRLRCRRCLHAMAAHPPELNDYAVLPCNGGKGACPCPGFEPWRMQAVERTVQL